MDIKTIGVVGAGSMGNGIAQVCAAAGYTVIMHDRAEEYVQRGLSTIQGSIGKFVEKGKMSAEDRDALLARLTTTTRLEDLAAADLVIEAVFEDFDVKKDVLIKLDDLVRPDAIIASNTSSISITKLAATTSKPE